MTTRASRNSGFRWIAGALVGCLAVTVALVAFAPSHKASLPPPPALGHRVARSFLRALAGRDWTTAQRLAYPGERLDPRDPTIVGLQNKIEGRVLVQTHATALGGLLGGSFAGAASPEPSGSKTYWFNAGPNSATVVLAPYKGHWRVWAWGSGPAIR